MDVPNLDWVIIFGYQNPDDYYVMIANETPEYSELFVLEDGERTRLGGVEKSMVPDQNWYEMELVREGNEIEVWYEGELQFVVEDDTYGEGRVGVGTFNDAAYFDDIEIAGPAEEDDGDDVGGDDVEGDDTGVAEDTGESADPGETEDAGRGDAGDDDPNLESDAGGCACSASGKGSPLVALVVLVGLLAIRRGQKRRSSAVGD